MTEPFKIRITKANLSRTWYNARIGEEFEVIRTYHEDKTYLVRTKDAFNTSNIVYQDDCELVE